MSVVTIAPTPTPHHGARLPRTVPAVVGAIGAAVLVVALLAHYGVLGSSATGETVGSGKAVSEHRSVGAFTAVELAGSNTVAVHVGPSRSVVVHGDDNLVGRVTTVVRGGRLVIADRPGSFATRAPMSVTVTVPSLDTLVLSGSGNVGVVGVNTLRLALTLTGSGNVVAAGSAATLDVSLAGSGTAQLRSLTARDVHATVSGSGAISVTATGSLDARVPGSGAILYAGSPAHVRTTITGSGAVTPLS